MHDVIVAGPTYQTSTARREPPGTPQSPRLDARPPPIPPRMNRKNQQTSGEGNTSPPPGEKNRIHVTPLGKQLDVYSPGVDSSKVNFKDLISQWNSNSPGENAYSDETSKRANKLQNKPSNGQQHNKPHKRTPPVISHPKPIINFATTYKQEPLVGQTSLSDVSMSPVPSSPTTSTACSSPSSTPVPSFSTSASNKQSNTINSQHSSWSSSPADQHKSRTPTQESSPSASKFSLEVSPHSQSSSNYNSPVMPPTSNAISVNVTKPLPAKRAATLERPRTASTSQILSNSSPGSNSQTSREDAFGRYPNFRERSSSQSDLLSDNTQNSQLPHHIKQRLWVPHNGIIPTASSKQTKEDFENKSAFRSSTSEHQTEQGIAKDNPEAPDYPTEDYQNLSAHDIQGYVELKNKSSNDTGQGFISTTELQSGVSDIPRTAEDTNHIPRQESRLGQHPWSSESALFHPDSSPIKPPWGLTKDKVKQGINTRPIPVRPQRPTAQARRILGQTSVPSVSSEADTSFNSWNHSAASLSDLNKSSPPGQHSQDQPRSGDYLRGSSQQKLASPTHSPKDPELRSNLHPQKVVTSDNSVCLHNEETQEIYTHNTQQSQFQREIDFDGVPSCINPSPHHDKHNTMPPQHTPHGSARPGNKPPSSNESPRKPRYRPRDQNNLPSSGMSSSTSVEDLTRPCEDSDFPSRRKSYSSASSTTRGKSYSFTFSKRQPSMEELECDEKAKQLENELEGRDRRLLEALRHDANTKRMLYMDGLFSDTEQVGFSQNLNDRNQTLPPMTAKPWRDEPGSWKSSTLPRDHQTKSLTTEAETECETGFDIVLDRSGNEELTKHKEELIDKLRKKLAVLKDEKATLQLEIADNCLLGQQVSQAADSKCPTEYEREKFRTHLDDVEKIVRLLLNLSGQLARAESAVTSLGPDADDNIKKLALDKKEKLHIKHEEAKQLKEAIDKRSSQLLVMLQGRFSEQELADYNHLIKTKSTLAIQLQELDDQILLAENQMVALRRSLSGSAIV